MSEPITIINAGYKSTNYWVISAGTSRMLFDLGYPGTMGLMRANLKRLGVPISEIKLALASHQSINNRGIRLQTHALLQAIEKHRSNQGALFGDRGFLLHD